MKPATQLEHYNSRELLCGLLSFRPLLLDVGALYLARNVSNFNVNSATQTEQSGSNISHVSSIDFSFFFIVIS